MAERPGDIDSDQEALDGDRQKLTLRIEEMRRQEIPVRVEMRLRAVGIDLERRQQRLLGFDDAGQRRIAEGPAAGMIVLHQRRNSFSTPVPSRALCARIAS